MKISLVLLVSFCAIALSVPTTHNEKFVKKDKVFLERQQKILQLFYRVMQPEYVNPEFQQISDSFSVIDHVDSFTKPEVVKTFIQHWKYGMLPRDKVFSIMNKEHMEEAVVVSKLFYFAKDFETFLKTAVWARQHVNQGIFVYAFTVALVHRPDCREFMIPPIYETIPHYFFNSDVISAAQFSKQTFDTNSHDKTFHTIVANYSGWYLNLHPEQSMSYFLEDVGVNAFYYYFNIFHPQWMSSEEFGWKDSRRGEVFFYMIQQVLAHFYAERISNGFGEVPFLDWDSPIETPFVSSLVHPNGLSFPNRPKFASLHEYFFTFGQRWANTPYGASHNLISDFERRIDDAIDSGVFFNEEHSTMKFDVENVFNVLGNLVESNADSPNRIFYGDIMTFARHVLGYSTLPLDEEKLAPSALEQFETSMRDPVFFQLLKKIFLKFDRFMALHVPPYTEKDLVFRGVKVTDMKVDSLVTFNDVFFTDLTNAVFFVPKEKFDFHVRARQSRLNHKPFNVNIDVKSEKDQSVSVKLFMAPKFDEWNREINLTENRRNMMELDHFVVNLKSGENKIVRNSQEFRMFADDRRSSNDLFDSVTEAIKNNGEFVVDGRQNYFNWPRRFMIPKGSRGGTAFQFVVVVYPFEGSNVQEIDPRTFIAPGTSEVFVDKRPLLFPFERLIKFEKMWYQIPNVFFHDVMVFFQEDVNSSVKQ